MWKCFQCIPWIKSFISLNMFQLFFVTLDHKLGNVLHVQRAGQEAPQLCGTWFAADLRIYNLILPHIGADYLMYWKAESYNHEDWNYRSAPWINFVGIFWRCYIHQSWCFTMTENSANTPKQRNARACEACRASKSRCIYKTQLGVCQRCEASGAECVVRTKARPLRTRIT